jgi:hypothetical protein
VRSIIASTTRFDRMGAKFLRFLLLGDFDASRLPGRQ